MISLSFLLSRDDHQHVTLVDGLACADQAVLEMTDFLPGTSLSFDASLWMLEGQSWVKLDEWGQQ